MTPPPLRAVDVSCCTVAGASVRWPGRILRASDSTCISKRAEDDWRVHALYDLGAAALPTWS